MVVYHLILINLKVKMLLNKFQTKNYKYCLKQSNSFELKTKIDRQIILLK